jgi:hypothetical protein
MRAHYDFSGGIRGRYVGKVDTKDVHRIPGKEPVSQGPAEVNDMNGNSQDAHDDVSRQRGRGANDKLFVELRAQGDYSVRRSGSERATAVEATQTAAIARARQLSKGRPILVERVRKTSAPSRDKWRRP